MNMKIFAFIDRQRLRFSPQRRARIYEACEGPNHPLFLEQEDIAFIWSAKAGCTFAVKWFLFQRGELEPALAYSDWIHDYRWQVYYRSDEYYAGVQRAEFGKCRYIRLVRNPFSRAVSSYLHMVRTLGNEAFHRPFNNFLGRDIEKPPGVSFSEFCDFLLSVDVERTDLHYRQQTHPLESQNMINVDHLIHIENLKAELATVEKRYGLKTASVSELSTSLHNTKRVESNTYVGDQPFLMTDEDIYPDYKAFYNEDLARKIRTVYAEDFSRYGYADRP
jgi:hypothetical protein